MEFHYSKRIDSFSLKKDLNKANSINEAKSASLSIKPGEERFSCPVCNSIEHKFIVTIYSFHYHECGGCGVLYLSNMPTDMEIAKIYKSDYYTRSNKILLANENIIDYRTENIAKPKVEFINKYHTTKKNKWLDIGCGVGEIISVASKSNWEVTGVETNVSEREFGIKKFGLNIVDDYINETNISRYNKNYGVISLFNVLEHIKDPHSIIKNISKIQDKEDNLVIEVPHYPSVSVYSQITFPDHVNRILHPPLHLFIYSLKALSFLLENHHYQITHVWLFGQDFYEVLSTLGLFAGNLNHSLLHDKLSTMINEFQEVIDKRDFSDAVLIIARKTS